MVRGCARRCSSVSRHPQALQRGRQRMCGPAESGRTVRQRHGSGSAGCCRMANGQATRQTREGWPRQRVQGRRSFGTKGARTTHTDKGSAIVTATTVDTRANERTRIPAGCNGCNGANRANHCATAMTVESVPLMVMHPIASFWYAAAKIASLARSPVASATTPTT